MVFDGDCAFCTASVRWLERRVARRPVVVSWQQADLDRLGLSVTQCTEAVQWVGADGRHLEGAAAIAATLRHAGRGWGVVGALMALPGIRSVARWVYRWVARNRHRLPGGTASCALDRPVADTPISERRGAEASGPPGPTAHRSH